MIKKSKKLFASATLGLLVGLGTLSTTCYAYSGNWSSHNYTDWDGVSQVGTKYTGSSPVSVYLQVRTGSNSNVGSKTVGAVKNQTVEHTCWGQPFLARNGVVRIKGSHNPFFNA